MLGYLLFALKYVNSLFQSMNSDGEKRFHWNAFIEKVSLLLLIFPAKRILISYFKIFFVSNLIQVNISIKWISIFLLLYFELFTFSMPLMHKWIFSKKNCSIFTYIFNIHLFFQYSLLCMIKENNSKQNTKKMIFYLIR